MKTQIVSTVVTVLLTLAVVFAVGGGIGPAQRAEIPHIVNVTPAIAANSTGNHTRFHVLYRTWSDGQVDYARVWNGNTTGASHAAIYTAENPSYVLNRETWQILNAN